MTAANDSPIPQSDIKISMIFQIIETVISSIGLIFCTCLGIYIICYIKVANKAKIKQNDRFMITVVFMVAIVFGLLLSRSILIIKWDLIK